jgi:two-component system, NtrC family, nitrogen regulation response regulator NtrX
MQTEIWVIDDEVGIRELLSEILEDEGFLVRLADSAGAARALRANGAPGLALLDIWMPDSDGVSLLKEWKANGLLTFPVIMLSGHASVETAVEATRIGAFDFLEKPIGLQKLLASVQRAIKAAPTQRRATVDLTALGGSAAIDDVRQRLERLINEGRPIFLTGEPGAGYVETARALHAPDTPWVVLEGGARLIASPLEILEQARRGTLFCEEVTELTRSEQKSLVFIITRAPQYNVRIVCASSEPLAQLVNEGAFDNSLYQGFAKMMVVLPPLRVRQEDVPGLMERFAEQVAPGSLARLTPEARALLEKSAWPGNLVQLQSVLSSVVFESSSTVTETHLLPLLGEGKAADVETNGVTTDVPARFLEMPLREAREAFEKVYFENLLSRESFNMSKIAERAGLERTHLYRKLKQLNIKFSRRGAQDDSGAVATLVPPQ